MNPSKPLKVLLADDDEVTREVLGMMLEDAGYEYETVSKGDDAVTRALSGAFAAVVMDFEMPVLNGLEATLRIRRLEDGKSKLPIIVLSAHTEKRGTVMGIGANAYLVKPVTAATLRTTLSSWITNAELEPEPVCAPMERQADLLDLFFDLVPARLRTMHESAEKQDLKRVRFEAHRLIGSCSVLGFPRMAAVARRVATGEVGPTAGVTQLEREFERIGAETCSR
jgi:CheY-like chemotaxis protein